jgi:aminomethyltransferase
MDMTDTPLSRYFESRGIPAYELARGLATPSRFADPVAEHLATRTACGLSDFSFMACGEIYGPGALAFLHRLQTRNLAPLAAGRIAYTLLLRENGTVLDDATVWRLAPDRFLLFAGRPSDLGHANALAAGFAVTLVERSPRQVVLAVQGEHAWAVVSQCIEELPPRLPYFAFCPGRFRSAACLVARIGYSGETGYEMVADARLGVELWEALRRAGAAYGMAECGFEAIDTLRIEAGHILFRQELEVAVTPFELGFGRWVDFYGTDFIGKSALTKLRWSAPPRRLVGLIPDDARGLVHGEPAGPGAGVTGATGHTAILTSLCRSPIFGRALGIGYVQAADAHPGTRVRLAHNRNCRVARLPFYDPARHRARRAF